MLASSSSPHTRTSTSPARAASARSSAASNVCTSTSLPSSLYVDSAWGECWDPFALGVALIALRQAGSTRPPTHFGTIARRSPWRDGSPMNASVPPGARTRWNSDIAVSSPGRWCSTACPITRSNDSSANGSASASASTASTSSPRPAAVSDSRRSMPGEMSVATACVDHACAQQVQREVAGAGPDLERPRVPAGRRAQRLAQLAQHLAGADLAVVDGPLRVVGVRRLIVVANVRRADAVCLDRAGRGRHGARGL